MLGHGHLKKNPPNHYLICSSSRTCQCQSVLAPATFSMLAFKGADESQLSKWPEPSLWIGHTLLPFPKTTNYKLATVPVIKPQLSHCSCLSRPLKWTDFSHCYSNSKQLQEIAPLGHKPYDGDVSSTGTCIHIRDHRHLLTLCKLYVGQLHFVPQRGDIKQICCTEAKGATEHKSLGLQFALWAWSCCSIRGNTAAVMGLSRFTAVAIALKKSVLE